MSAGSLNGGRFPVPETPRAEEAAIAGWNLAEQLLWRIKTHPGHPGRPCHQSGWIDDERIAQWQAEINAARNTLPVPHAVTEALREANNQETVT